MITRIYIRDLRHAADVRRKTKVRIHILKKRGVKNFIKRYKKRVLFAVCAALAAAAVYQSSRHIWTVEINGVKDADITRIAQLLEENGIYTGASKSKLLPIGDIKNNILADYPEISWLWVYMEGTKARVEVFERRAHHEIVDKHIPCDIVSSGEGVIKKLTVKAGRPAVAAGDAVTYGDTLISGQIDANGAEGTNKRLLVHALGEVSAYTMHSAEKDEPLYDEIRTPTGAVKRYITLEIFGKKYDLFRGMAEDYADYDIKTDCYELTLPMFGYTGLSVTSQKHIEVQPEREPVSEELAAARARDALEEEIAKTLTPLARRTDERLEYKKVSDDIIRVKCTMSFIENIGTEEIIKE